ncbi:hypothetical protein HMPREF0454_03802 [Hafnia alvei ATCC 51873]|uniref:Uncharacterized protein n=1 Tax=Hafnia alvei ATCC 51873 TaxID=1002364 RepID=G9YB39_HAFAL|nr:hypothetical protein HMPREF0454_03802 [Hafnia alvei ATCC 51873]
MTDIAILATSHAIITTDLNQCFWYPFGEWLTRGFLFYVRLA